MAVVGGTVEGSPTFLADNRSSSEKLYSLSSGSPSAGAAVPQGGTSMCRWLCRPNRAGVTTPLLERRPSLPCRRVDHPSSISWGLKSRRLRPGWKVLGRRGVLLDERGGRQYRPQLLAGVEGVRGRVHVLFQRIDPRVHRTGHGGSQHRAGEPCVLDQEGHLPVVVTQREQVRLALADLRAGVEAERVLP